MDRKRPYSYEYADLFKDRQFALDKIAKDFERRAKKSPFLCAKEAWYVTQSVVDHLREKSMELYGVDVGGPYGHLILQMALEPTEDGMRPRNGTLGACTVAVCSVHLYYDYLTNFAAMKSASRRPDIRGTNLAQCICELHTTMTRESMRGAFVACETVQNKFPKTARREALAEMLTGYFLTRLSTNSQHRLGPALSDDKRKLPEELPAEALIVWAERGDEDLKGLRNRISNRLAQTGRESLAKDKMVDVASDVSGMHDAALLEQFRLREIAEQEIKDLNRWVEHAAFSKQQRQVYELDMSTNHKTSEIARELSIAENHVRKVRHDYIKKIKKVKKAAGF